MKHFKTLFTALFLIIAIHNTAQNTEAFFTLQPTLTPNGETIVFSYEGDSMESTNRWW